MSDTIAASVIVLTMGDRPGELAALAESLRVGTNLERVIVANGGGPFDVPVGWKLVESPENLGVPGGRDFGARESRGEVLIFIDDDAVVRTVDLVDRVVARFETQSDLGALGFRIAIPGSDAGQSRWSPHLGAKKALVSGDVTTFVGGGHAIRRSAYDQVGGYWCPLFYGLEETDLAWRLLDRDWRVAYDADLVIEHPDTPQTRHTDVLETLARNRVWLARRHLPALLAVVYVMVWLTIQLLRSGGLGGVRATASGTLAGLREPAGDRRPIRWKTVWRMLKLGRPPVI